MARKAKPAPLDVFLSYKREEKAVAQLLAEFLTERGFDVWWDAALLAGDDFAAIVHEEVREAKAVVVLWSRQAIDSHWVKAEATLALAGGTLINAVIDDLPFDEIPGEFRHIQAVRLEAEHNGAFYATIAAAIERKGTRPSQSTQSATAAKITLKRKLSQSQFFLAISQSSDPLDFKEYLERYGDTGQFASIAMRKIIALEQQRIERRKLSNRVWLGLGGAATVVSILAGVVALLQFAGIATLFGGGEQPVPDNQVVVEDKGDIIPPVVGGGSGTITKPEPVDPNAPKATYTTYQFGVPMEEASADVDWGTTLYLGGTNVVATAAFSDLNTGFDVTFTDPGPGIAADQIVLSVTPTGAALLGPRPPAAITSVGAAGFMDERRLVGTGLPAEAGKLSYSLDAAANRDAGNFTVLVSADALVIDLNLEGEQTAALRLELSPEIRPTLETILNRQAKSLLDTIKDIYVTPADPEANPLTAAPVTQ